MRAGGIAHRIRLVASMPAVPSCIGQIVTRPCTRDSRAVGVAAAELPTTRAPYWYMFTHRTRGHSSGRPRIAYTRHHSCRTYFVMCICVLRDLTGTTRLRSYRPHAALCGVTAHTGVASGEEVRGGSGVWGRPQPRPHRARDQNLQRQNVIGTGDSLCGFARKSRSIPHKKPKRKRQRCGLSTRFPHTRTSRFRFVGTLII